MTNAARQQMFLHLSLITISTITSMQFRRSRTRVAMLTRPTKVFGTSSRQMTTQSPGLPFLIKRFPQDYHFILEHASRLDASGQLLLLLTQVMS
jgi:hypothetical protein